MSALGRLGTGQFDTGKLHGNIHVFLLTHHFFNNQVYPQKYSRLVEEEQGLVLLNELILHPSSSEEIKGLANMVIKNCYLILDSQLKNESMILDG